MHHMSDRIAGIIMVLLLALLAISLHLISTPAGAQARIADRLNETNVISAGIVNDDIMEPMNFERRGNGPLTLDQLLSGSTKMSNQRPNWVL